MRKFINFFFVLLAFGPLVYILYELNSPICSKALKYGVGSFDSAFGITKEDFRMVALQAESVWENELERNVFIYDSEADFKINLIYDEKQLATIQKQKTESGLTALESEFETLDRQLTTLKFEYESKVQSYKNRLTSFDQKKSSYESKVAQWNSKGGAPQSVYSSLEEERRILNSEASSLNAEANSLNVMADRLNDAVVLRNKKADEYNRAAREYNKKYGEGLEFNQAEYTGEEINVYQFGDKSELLLALVHEFGHALGMDHVENPDSVMYYLSSGMAETNTELSTEDIEELNRVCESNKFLFW